MDEPKFTPGHWRWIDGGDWSHSLVSGDALMPIAPVVLVCGAVSTYDQDLIAASPDLYAACAETVRWLREDTVADLNELSDDAKTILITLMEALAKARGETP